MSHHHLSRFQRLDFSFLLVLTSFPSPSLLQIFNEEGSWVYQDANVLEQNLPLLWASHIVGSGLPGADGTPGGGSSAVPSAVGTGTSTPASASVTDGGEPRKVMLKFGAGAGAPGAGAGAGPSRLREEEDQDQDSASSDEE